MEAHRAIVSFALACVPWAATAAQDAPPAAKRATPFGPAETVHTPADAAAAPALEVWIAYDRTDGVFLDHLDYLAALQRKLAAKGVAIGVVFLGAPPAGVATVAARKPALAIAMRAERGEVDLATSGHMVALGTADVTLGLCPQLDGVVDVLHACGGGDAAVQEAIAQMALLDEGANLVGDGELPEELATRLPQALPRSGTAHALALLHAWWGSGDYAAAEQAFAAGLKALVGESVPLVMFADLALRGDRIDPALATRLAIELAPIAAAAPDGPLTQLVYLRALLRSRQDRVAGRVVAVLQKRFGGQPRWQVQFAETLMEAADPAPYRDLASRALDAAATDGWDPHQLVMARHKVASRCGDAAAADKLVKEFREQGGGGDLNNDAWYTMVQLGTMGRFDSYALAQCEELQRVEGEGISNGNKDTVALALFCNGRLADAIALQTVAAAASGRDARYEARLRRFQAAAERRANPPPARDKPPK